MMASIAHLLGFNPCGTLLHSEDSARCYRGHSEHTLLGLGPETHLRGVGFCGKLRDRESNPGHPRFSCRLQH